MRCILRFGGHFGGHLNCLILRSLPNRTRVLKFKLFNHHISNMATEGTEQELGIGWVLGIGKHGVNWNMICRSTEMEMEKWISTWIPAVFYLFKTTDVHLSSRIFGEDV